MEKSPSWSRAHDWKSCRPLKGLEGSNPSFSAKGKALYRNWYKAFLLSIFKRAFKLICASCSNTGSNTGSFQQLIDYLNSAPLHLYRDMGIQVQGDTDAGMAQHGGHDFRRDMVS